MKYKENNKTSNEKVKIDVPKKSPLYRDFMQREKESKTKIHKKFITALIRLKYKAIDTYVKILKKEMIRKILAIQIILNYQLLLKD